MQLSDVKFNKLRRQLNPN